VAAPDSVVQALEQALAAAPDDVDLRLHLAQVLIDRDEPDRSLEHARKALEQHPDRVEAFELAAIAAVRLGDQPLADRYQRGAQALGAPPPLEVPRPPVIPEVDETERFVTAEGLDADHPANGGSRDAVEAGVERPEVRLDDVGGLEDVKRQLRASFLGPMQNPELRAMYRKSLRGGLLLYGPPGCGKTFLARALAGELGAAFFAVGLHDVLDMWLGSSERNVHAIFDVARRNSPCVLFIDEIDALGQKRAHLQHSAGRNVVVQLLNEMDGANFDNEGVFVLGATNQPWDVDPALLRPGRFDRTVLVVPPDAPAREAILRYHLRDRPVERVDVGRLAKDSDGLSGADLAMVCESAAELAIEASVSSGTPRPIGHADLDAALRGAVPSTRTWFEGAKNYVQFANEGGRYDDLLAYMRARRMV
jgi:SpoVK/Ycf46/Vps4 family AAA+-type ATPase